jgi:nanoRNase/pAp phosphatase (c-di-AMP/oligoRNAs hydrolase)
MNNNSGSLKDLIEKSKSVLLVFPHIINSDVCASLGLTYKLLKEKFGKEVEIVSQRSIPTRFHEILKKSGIDIASIGNEVKPISYVIRVNDTEETLDIQYKNEKGKLDIILTPENQSIDFNKVSFVNQGGLYDLVVTFNIARLEDLGKIYTNSKKLFKKYQIVSISNQLDQENFAKLKIVNDKTSTSSELLYNLYADLGIQLENIDAEIVAHGIIGSTYGLHQVTTPQTYEIISELANKYKVDLAKIVNTYFYSQDKVGLKFRERLLENVKIDENAKLIYSSLTSSDFRELHLTAKDIDGIDYLPFNICKDYDIAFLAYEDNAKTTILVHANDPKKNLNSLVRQFNGTGSKLHGIINFDKDLQTAINTVLNALGAKSSASINTQKSEEIKKQEVSFAPKPQVQQTQASFTSQNTQYTPPVQPISNTQPQAQQSQTSYTPTSQIQNTPVSAPQVQSMPQASSPFTRASAPVLDEAAKPSKTPPQGAYGFSSADKPFQPGV